MAGAGRPLTLPAGDRLRRASDFQAVFQRGKRVEREDFVALWHESEGARKVGFTVARKVRGAARRNRVRRRLREAYRQRQGALPRGVRVIFVGRAREEETPFRALSAVMRGALEEIAARAQLLGAGER